MSMKSVAILIINDDVISAKFQSLNVIKFFKEKLKEIQYEVPKISILQGNENIINYEIDFMLKHYDIVLITGGIKSGILHRTVGKFLSQHHLPCNGIAALPQASNSVKTTCKFNDISIPLSAISNSEIDYPLIYFQRIFIICGEDYEEIFTILLEPYLVQYRKDSLYKKSYQVTVNGNSNFSYIDELRNENVKIFYHMANQILNVEILSAEFNSLIEVEEKFRHYLILDRLQNEDYYVPLEEIHACGDLYVQNAIKNIEKCLELYGPENIFLSFNGGKDCTVLLHLICIVLKKLYPTYKKPLLCMYVQSKSPFQEQNEFIRQCEIYYNLNILTFQTSIKMALLQMLNTYPNLQACLMGTRRTDPFSSKLDIFAMTDKDWPQIMRVSPLLDWHYSDIWDYILYFKVPYCILYKIGFTSLGSQEDTVKNPSLLYYDVMLDQELYLPAYKLLKEAKERNGRSGNRL